MIEPTTPEFCFLWINHWSTCMTKAEWSGWVQAIGSIAVITWAVAIFTADRRRDRSAAMETAKFLAVGIDRRLMVLTVTIDEHLQRFDHIANNDGDFREFEIFRDSVSSLVFPSDSLILQLRPVLKGEANALAAGIAYVFDAKMAATFVRAKPENLTSGQRKRYAGEVASFLREASEKFHSVLRRLAPCESL